jgi:hypothetical protein
MLTNFYGAFHCGAAGAVGHTISPTFHITVNAGSGDANAIAQTVKQVIGGNMRELIGLLRKAERADFRTAIV